MKPIVIIDFNQIVVASCAVQSKELKLHSDKAKSMIKHLTLSIILGLKKKFKPEKIIIACDSNLYWRKQVFPYYKGHRASIKEASEFIDWDLLHETVDELKVELADSFPYIILNVEGAEADDVIGVLCKYYQENELVHTGLMEEPRDIIICSSDGDFPPLQKYRNVKQWNNVQKQFIVCDNPNNYLMEKIATGDSGDNIPSITNGVEWSKARISGEKLRAKPLAKVRYTEFHENGIDACKDDFERKNWVRNSILIDLDRIPLHINRKVVLAYEGYVSKSNSNKIFKYLINQRMNMLIGSVSDF